MTPEEHQLIADLFERMRSFGAVEKDREAEAFINQAVRSTPDSAYKLVQSVLVQENALQEAGTRIQDLEDQLAQMQSQLQARPQAASGGFLGGLFGGSKPAQPAPLPMQRPTSGVPITGARAAATPWGGQQQPMAGAGYQQPMMGQPQQRAGGGFMKTAMATAAGVAGGMLVAGAIKDMMGNNQAQAATPRDGDAASPYEVANTAADPASAPQYQDPASNDPGTYQEDTAGQDDQGGGWFGGGGGSDDREF